MKKMEKEPAGRIAECTMGRNGAEKDNKNDPDAASDAGKLFSEKLLQKKCGQKQTEGLSH